MSQSADVVKQYEEKISAAIAKLGPAEGGKVWLYRAEHLKDVPVDQVNTEHYTTEEIETLQDAKGRWFGDDLAKRFQHLYFYTKNEPNDGVENLRISAVQVPLDIAANCYLGRVPMPHQNLAWEMLSPLQRGRTTSTSPGEEYFLPPALHASDVGTDGGARSRAQDLTRVLQGLEGEKQTLCEIPLADYKKASAEAWYNMAANLDAQHSTATTRDKVLFYTPPTQQQAVTTQL